jgi:two-component system, NtrC family, nitrogen regulation sensor histidine kinase NtrY
MVWFALSTVVPIATAAIGTREVLSDSYIQSYTRRLQSVEILAQQELDRVRKGIARTVESLSKPDSFYIGGLLIELDKSNGRLEPNSPALTRLGQQGKPLMEALELQLMVVADGKSTVLYSPHNRAETGEVEPRWAELAVKTRGAAFFASELMITDGGQIGQKLVVEAARSTRLGPYRATIAAGQIIGGAMLKPLQDSEVDARIVDPRGAVLVKPLRPWTGEATGPVIRLSLDGADGRPVAKLEVALSQAELQTVLRQVTLLSAGLGGAALVITVLLGLWVSTRMTRDLDELVVGAQAASRGDLDHEVPVRTRDEIGAVAEAFNAMMSDLRESKEKLVIAERVAAWQEIARHLAHEIKNPLTPIQMSVETLRKTRANQHPSFDEIFEESTHTVLEEAARLKRIVSEFSEFARLPKPERRRMDLHEVVNGAVSLYQGSMTIERDLAGNLPHIEADRDQLSQVLLNLLENARDALPKGEGASARIRVQTRVERPGRSVALVVEDSGPGIASEARDRIFTPYYTTKHASGGTGLGLAIVHRIVSDHGGRITVTDSSLGGARFVIELPIAGSGGELGASLRG